MIKLRADQIAAINNIHNGNILCGGVGSGKSLTALGYYYQENGGKIVNGTMTSRMMNPRDLYIITTAAKRDKHEWDHELLAIYLSVNSENLVYKNKVVIDSWNNIKKYITVSNAFFIFDEQRVVGSGAWVKAFYKIAAKNRWILLSATPGDKWEDYIPVFVANGFYRNKTEFVREHLIYNYHVSFPQVSGYLGEKKLRRLRDQILVDIDFQRQTQQHHETVIVSYNRDLYKEVIRTRRNPYKEIKINGIVTKKPIDNASEFCAVLHRISNSDPSRGERVLDICNKFPKVIIYYNYTFELEILRSLKYKQGTTIAEWNGQKHDKLPQTDRWVYLVQYNAGAEGWNCTETNCMIFYSECYSYRAMEQAAGRIDRANTSFKDLYYWHIRSTSSIDISIKRALDEKKKFNASAFYKRHII